MLRRACGQEKTGISSQSHKGDSVPTEISTLHSRFGGLGLASSWLRSRRNHRRGRHSCWRCARTSALPGSRLCRFPAPFGVLILVFWFAPRMAGAGDGVSSGRRGRTAGLRAGPAGRRPSPGTDGRLSGRLPDRDKDFICMASMGRGFGAALVSAGIGDLIILASGAMGLALLGHAAAGSVLSAGGSEGVSSRRGAEDSGRCWHCSGSAARSAQILRHRCLSERTTIFVSNEKSAVASTSAVTDISIAHSPDSDDAFMFYGLATNKVRVPGYRFSHTLSDIENAESPRARGSVLRRHGGQLSCLSLHPGKLRADGLRRKRGRGLRTDGGGQSAYELRRSASACASLFQAG